MHQIELTKDFNSVKSSGKTVIFFALFMTLQHALQSNVNAKEECSIIHADVD